MKSWYKRVTWPENLFREVLWNNDFNGPEMPADFLGSLEYILHSTMTEREALVLRCRYQNEETYGMIGLRVGVQQERIRQILNKAIRKLRHPARSKYLKYGVAKQVERFGELCREEAFKEGYQESIRNAQEDMDEIQPVVNPYGEQNLVPVNAVEDIPIENLDLSVRLYNGLKRSNINTIGDLLKKTKQEVFRIRNLGVQSLRELEEKLAQYDVQLREND